MATISYDYDNSMHYPNITPVQTFYPQLSQIGNVQRPLADRVTLVKTEGNTQTNQIDNAIQAQVPSKAFRDKMAHHWDAKRTSSAWAAALAGAVTVLSGIGAFVKSEDPLMCTALAVGAAFALLFTGLNLYWTSQASAQKAGWSVDPAGEIANQRKEAYDKGFVHVFDHRLKLV